MDKYCPRCFKHFPSTTDTCPDDGSNLVQLSDKDLVGHVLDNRYTVKGRVGKGGMGVVYEAEQHLIGRVVALKVLSREIVKDDTSVKRFLNEARVIASLENRHTVTLYDFGVTSDGLLYYTMELLSGRPLSGIIQDDGPMDFRRAATIMFQALESLEEAHDKGILHRDVKPDNLFVLRKNGEERVKVLDFGIAKLLGDSGSETITKTGMICGTPQYLSPEQVLGNAATPASDLYSLGIVFYEMLAGQPPFYSPTPMKLLLKHLNEEPEPVSVKNPAVTVPASINAFLEQALRKDPQERYATVAVFREALQQALYAHDEEPTAEPIAGIATTSDGLRALSAERASKTPRQGGKVVRPGDTRSDRPGTLVDTGTDLKQPDLGTDETVTVATPMPGALTGDEPTELAVSGSRGKGILLGAGLTVLAVLVGVLLVWQPWSSQEEPAADPGQVAEEEVEVPATEPVPVEEPAEEAAAGELATERQRLETEAQRLRIEKMQFEREKLATETEKMRQERARLATEEQKTAEEARLKAEEEAQKKAAEEAQKKAAEEAQKKAAEEARLKAEEEAQKKAEEEARLKAEEEAQKKAEARKKASAKRKAEEEAKKKAEEEAKKKAEEEAKKKTERKFVRIGEEPADKKPPKDDKGGDSSPGFKRIPIE